MLDDEEEIELRVSRCGEVWYLETGGKTGADEGWMAVGLGIVKEGSVVEFAFGA